MKSNKIKVDGLTFVEGTKRYKVYQLHKEGKTPEEISKITATDVCRIRYYLYKFRKLSSIVRTEPEQVEEETPTGRTRTTPEGVVTLKLEIKEERGEYYLFVKTSEEFENWLRTNREIKSTTQLWGGNQTEPTEYYQYKLIDNYLDDINTPIFYGGKVNFAILRLKGSSQGLKFKVDGLLTETQLRKALKLFPLTYKKFFKENIEVHRVNYVVEVLEEI